MKILEYPRAGALKPTDVFLLDGPDGTRGITAENLAEALGAVGDGSGLVNNIHLGALAETDLLKKTDAILVETADGNRRAVTNANLYWQLTDIGKAPYASDVGSRTRFRRKNLGSVVTDAQYARIKEGSFFDLYVGDYWEIGGNAWDIVDINYWFNMGDEGAPMTTPHLVIMPRNHLFTYGMNETNTTSTGYRNSAMFNNGLPMAYNIIKGAFGDSHIMRRTELISYACDSSGNIASEGFVGGIVVSIPSSYMMFGHAVSNNYLGGTLDVDQLALMQMHPYYAFVRGAACWLRDPVNGVAFAATSHLGGYMGPDATSQLGVRPVFGLVG